MNLKIVNLNKKYSDFKLENISFEINDGSIMGFVGANGAGKSTTIKLIMNLINRDSGEILFDGKPLSKDIKNDIGIVFDECYYFNTMNAIGINSLQSKIYKNWDSDLFFDYLNTFNIPKEKEIEKFSKGMKMKLNIAAALSSKPKLLILDEATTGLDPIVRNQILDIFADFVSSGENSILISSHIVSDLERLCDKITYIDDGKLLFSIDRNTLLNNYACIKCTESDLKKYDKYKYHKIRNDYYVLVENGKFKESRAATIEDIILITGGKLN